MKPLQDVGSTCGVNMDQWQKLIPFFLGGGLLVFRLFCFYFEGPFGEARYCHYRVYQLFVRS